MKRTYRLPENFLVGASSSGWQTEGWGLKGEIRDSWVDAFYKACPERWHHGIGPTIATDFIHRYKEDIQMMKTISLQCYRTSIQWPRFIKNPYTFEVDEEYAQFFEDMLKEQIAQGITPMICLEHWEIPNELVVELGGWTNRQTVDLYVGYAKKAIQRYSHLVKQWFTFNEPGVPNNLGYLEGMWYPFKADAKASYQAHYHKVLATSLVKKYITDNQVDIQLGIILNLSPVYPRTTETWDTYAAHMAELLGDRFYLDALIHGKFPTELIETLHKHHIMFSYEESELKDIEMNSVDILGVNYYQPQRVKARYTKFRDDAPFHPSYYYEGWDLPGKKMNPHRGWEIYGKGMYDIAMNIKDNYNNIPWIITENGMGVEGEERFKNAAGEIQDDYRIDYISDHLRWLVQGIEEGSNCFGYMMWAATDNCSPMNAFKNRYGYIEVDLSDNLKRRIKKSGHFIKQTIDTKSFVYDDIKPEYK